MEVRCEQCNKLFRVSDDKITGKGVKFPCTRCGDYVKITREAFERYRLSHDAAAGAFEEAPAPAPALTPSPQEPEAQAPPAAPGILDFDLSASAEPDAQREEPVPPSFEPAPFAHPETVAEAGPLSAPPGTAQESSAAPEKEPAAAPVQEPQPLPAEPKPAPRAATDAGRAAVKPARKTPAVIAATSKRGPVRTSQPAVRVSSRRSRKALPALVLAFILIALAGYAVYEYGWPTLQGMLNEKKQPAPVTAPATGGGLRILNETSIVEPSGDLRITGTVENKTEKDIPVWYVVVDVYDTNGIVLSRLRALNGRQLFTNRDYAVFAARGVNVEEQREKDLRMGGAGVPAKGSASFEVRYLQPPSGISTFVPMLMPYDAARVANELSGDVR